MAVLGPFHGWPVSTTLALTGGCDFLREPFCHSAMKYAIMSSVLYSILSDEAPLKPDIMASITCESYVRDDISRTKRAMYPSRPLLLHPTTTCLAPTLPPSHPANLVPPWVVAVCSSPTSTWLKFMVNALNKVVVDLMLHEQSDKPPLPYPP